MKKYLFVLWCLLTTVSIHSWGQITIDISTDSICHAGRRIIKVKIKNVSKDLTYGYGGELMLVSDNIVKINDKSGNDYKCYYEEYLFPNTWMYYLKPNETYTFKSVLYDEIPSKYVAKVCLHYLPYKFPKKIDIKKITIAELQKYKLKGLIKMTYSKLLGERSYI